MKKFYLILSTLLLTFTSYSQSDDSISIPTKRFWGYGGFGVPHLDFTVTDIDFLSKQLLAHKIPSNPLHNSFQYSLHVGLVRNKMFYSATAGYDATREDLNDTLRLKMSARVFDVAIGPNVMVRKNFILSPYVGLKYNRFRNITYSTNTQTIDNYLNNRDIDIRIHQFSMTVGLNFAFNHKNCAYGFYIAYVQKLHSNALMYSAGHPIRNPYGSPIGLLNIGLGMGFGN